MSRYARVTSIDVLQIVAGAIQKFRGDSANVLDELDMETRRAQGWMHHDRKDYWARELRRSEEAVTHARLQLQQAKAVRRVADREPACDEEKRLLARAQRRHEVAQRKMAAVGRWTRAIDHAIDEYQRARIQFQAWMDSDLVKGVAALDRMSASLESYTSLSAPAASEEQLMGQYAEPVGGAGVSPDEKPGADSGETSAASAADQPEAPASAGATEAAGTEADPTLDKKGKRMMASHDLHGAASRLENALKAFRTTFSTIDQQWKDVARRDFEETYLTPMEPQVHQMIAAISRLAAVLNSADSECGADYGAGNE